MLTAGDIDSHIGIVLHGDVSDFQSLQMQVAGLN